MCEALADRDLIRPAAEKLYDVTPEGRVWFEALGVDVEALRSPRGVARQCLDWTERRHHLAGPLGVKLLEAMTQRGWLSWRRRDGRCG